MAAKRDLLSGYKAGKYFCELLGAPKGSRLSGQHAEIAPAPLSDLRIRRIDQGVIQDRERLGLELLPCTTECGFRHALVCDRLIGNNFEELIERT